MDPFIEGTLIFCRFYPLWVSDEVLAGLRATASRRNGNDGLELPPLLSIGWRRGEEVQEIMGGSRLPFAA
jgi:hypothetical protein